MDKSQVSPRSDIVHVSLADEMRQSYLDYAMSVIVSRAIPDVCDGLKPVHRRILYTMYEGGYHANKAFRKSARITGDVLGKYHPHGSVAIYDAMVRMAQDFSMSLPLVDGQGNFGSMDGDPPAAERYTEARLAQVAGALLADIDEGTVPFQANYDWLEILLVAAVMTAFLRLSESRIGRAWVAIREDELAAAATGINTTRLKLLAVALGATLAGAAGTVDAHVVKVAAPDSFTFLESALLLAAVILGGMGTVPGALLGATVLYLLPEKLRFLQDLRLLVFGIVLVLLMRFRPEGLVPSKRRAREFHEGQGGGDALAASPAHVEAPA